MSLAVSHEHVATQVDGDDATELQPSHWNAAHQVSGGVPADVGLANVPNVDTSTAANITDATDKRFITDAQRVVLGNTSGTNTGDQDLSGYVPTTRTVAGHALSGNVSVTAADVGLGSVSNDAQTKAAIVPNTAPSAGQLLVGNAGGTAYAPVAFSGDGTLSSAGAFALTKDLFANTTTEISITGAATATIGRQHVCSGTSADYTLALPAASGNAGKLIGIRMSTALTKLVTIDANATELINGALTRVMWAGESAILLCDGANWFKLGGLSIPMTCLMQISTNPVFNHDTLTKINLNTVVYDQTSSLMGDTTNHLINILRPGIWDLGWAAYPNGYATYTQVEVHRTSDNAQQAVYLVDISPMTSPKLNAIMAFAKKVKFTSVDAVTLYAENGLIDTGVFGGAYTYLQVTEVPSW